MGCCFASVMRQAELAGTVALGHSKPRNQVKTSHYGGRYMHSWKVKRSLTVLVAAVVITSAMALAQTQGQSIWQKIKSSAKQSGQNTAQQGAQQVQQGVQQGVGAVGNQVGGGQQPPCGSLSGGTANGPTLTNAAFGGAGGNGTVGAGSCGQNCFNAGPFAAAISQMTMSQQNGLHIIRMEVQFHNASNQPLAIAYHDGSMVMVDENGNTYQGAGGNPGEVQGMGIDRGNQTDPQFVLGPGQTSSALFSVARYRANTSPIGTAFTYNLTIDELQAQNGADAIVARQYNLNFPGVAPGSSGGAFPSAAPASGFVGGNNGTAAGVGKGAAIGSAPINSRTSVPAQRNTVNPRVGMATAAAPNRRGAVQGAVNNAAMRTTATPATAAAAVRPVPAKAAAPVPAKAAVKKSATTTPAAAK
jgi:hypothetical protein